MNPFEQTRQDNFGTSSARQGVSVKADFIKKTYQFFAASLLAGAVGAYVGIGYAPIIAQYHFAFLILEIGLILGLNFTRNKQGLNIVLLFAFALVSGLTITPLLAYTMQIPGGAGIVTNAFVLTSVAFGGLSVFAMNTKKDFTVMGKMLFISLIVIIVASVINIFMQSSFMSVAISSISAILFSAFILYDTQNIIKGNYQTPVDGAVALYLDFLNLFVALLHILGIFGGDD